MNFMINNIFIFAVAIFFVIKGATLAVRYATQLAESFRLSKYTVGFIVISVISILPESFIAINAAIAGVPSFGLGMLFGSNISDLTLVFAVIILLAGRSLKIESKILKNHVVYPFILLLPIILGFDGFYSRWEGAALIVAGAIFYYTALKNSIDNTLPPSNGVGRGKNLLFLLASMVLLLVGAHFTVSAATTLAEMAGVTPILIGMLVVGLGTTMPEFFFALKSVKKNDDSLAVGDLLGTVLADATIVVGVLALVHPFAFPKSIVYVTGLFMVAASFLLFYFMRSGHTVTKREASLLLMFWIVFVLVEFIINT